MARIETPIGEMWVDEHGVRWHRITKQERITVEDAAEVQRIAAELTQGKPAPAVVAGPLPFVRTCRPLPAAMYARTEESP